MRLVRRADCFPKTHIAVAIDCHRDGQLPRLVPAAGVRPAAITGRRAGRGQLHGTGAGFAARERLRRQPQDGPTLQTEE